MKVFDLICEQNHRFEGWFGSAEDYDSQQTRGLVECPMCGSHAVRRLPSASRLNLSGTREPAGEPGRASTAETTPMQVTAGAPVPHLQAMWAQMVQHVIKNTVDVGDRFAEEARRIHYREAPQRGIRGVATAEQANALAEEGIEVVAMQLPKYSSEKFQ